MLNFSEVKYLEINGKEVQQLKINEKIIWEKTNEETTETEEAK